MGENKMNFNELQINIAKILNTASSIYQNCFLYEDRFRDQFENGYKALDCFLSNYAYARQGAPASYVEIARKCISDRYQTGHSWSVPTIVDAINVWEDFKQIATSTDFNLVDKKGEAKVNKTRNPLNADRGVIYWLASENISNIAVYIRNLIADGNTNDAYKFMKKIRGVGEKISSLYLRDIVYLAGLDEDNISDLYLLQPIDTWLEQTLIILFGSDVPETLKEKQELIVGYVKNREFRLYPLIKVNGY